jgi:hypothetical protein
MITARAERPSRVPSIVSASADLERGEQHEQAVDRIVDGQHPDRAGHKVGDQLNVAAKRQRDELADHDPESPGRKYGVKRATVERADDEKLGDAAQESSRDEGDRQTRPRIEPQLYGGNGAIGPDRQPRAMCEVDDLEHAEYGQ